MKSITALAAGVVALLAVSTNAAETVVTPGDKTYNVGLTFSPGEKNFCGGLLITPKHVLSLGLCTGWSEFAMVGDNVGQGVPTIGEAIRITKKTRHPKQSSDLAVFSFTIFELERASKFTPVALADRDAYAYAGNMTSSFGWAGGVFNPPSTDVLLRTTQTVRTEAECAAMSMASPSFFCAGGTENDNNCRGEAGGPVVIERPGKPDLALGSVFRGDGCGVVGAPGQFTRAYAVKDWIIANAPGVKFE